MNKYIYILILVMGVASCWGQSKRSSKFSEEELPVHNELFVGGGINTRGFQVNVAYSLIQSPFRTLSFLWILGK